MFQDYTNPDNLLYLINKNEWALTDNLYEARIVNEKRQQDRLDTLIQCHKNTPTLNMWVTRNGKRYKEDVPWPYLTNGKIKEIKITVI